MDDVEPFNEAKATERLRADIANGLDNIPIRTVIGPPCATFEVDGVIYHYRHVSLMAGHIGNADEAMAMFRAMFCSLMEPGKPLVWRIMPEMDEHSCERGTFKFYARWVQVPTQAVAEEAERIGRDFRESRASA